MRCAVTLAVLMAFAAPARADEVAPVPPPEVPTPEAAVDARDDAGWQLYDDAFAALARGDKSEATKLVRQLLTDHPGHPAIAEAGPLIALLDPPPTAADTVIVKPRGPEEPRKSARAELAIFQTIHGIYAGIELCILLGCDDAGPILGLALVGGAGGLGGSLLATSDGITDGQRALLNSGTFWGFTNAALGMAIAEPDDEKTIFGGMLVGQIVGLAVGAGIGTIDERPRSGQVALANSGGTWLAALTGLTTVAVADDLDGKAAVSAILVAADVGLIAGGYLASKLPRISRSQTLVYDAGGILGGVIGGGAYVLITNESDRGAAGFAAAGAALGLGTAAYLTRNWNVDTDVGPVRGALVPTEGGALASFSLPWN